MVVVHHHDGLAVAVVLLHDGLREVGVHLLVATVERVDLVLAMYGALLRSQR